MMRQRQAAQISAIRRTATPAQTATALLMATDALHGLTGTQQAQIIAALIKDSTALCSQRCEALSNEIGRHAHELARNERTTA